MPALSSLDLTFSPNRNWTARLAQTGYNSITKTDQFNTPVIQMGTAQANNAVGGADMLLSAIYTIAASGNTTVDLTTFTDVLQRAAQSFARVKYIEFWLQTAADNPSTPGTNASQVTVGAAGSNPFVMELGGTSPTKILKSGEFGVWGTRGATGLTVSGTNKSILITNNDASLSAVVQVTIAGGTT